MRKQRRETTIASTVVTESFSRPRAHKACDGNKEGSKKGGADADETIPITDEMVFGGDLSSNGNDGSEDNTVEQKSRVAASSAPFVSPKGQSQHQKTMREVSAATTSMVVAAAASSKQQVHKATAVAVETKDTTANFDSLNFDNQDLGKTDTELVLHKNKESCPSRRSAELNISWIRIPEEESVENNPINLLKGGSKDLAIAMARVGAIDIMLGKINKYIFAVIQHE